MKTTKVLFMSSEEPDNNSNNAYDIFISYRREGGADKARVLKTELEKRGFKVFLDFDELKDGIFDERIMDAIKGAPIFMLLLSPNALDRCCEEGDWVRKEIEVAIKTERHIIPVNPDLSFKNFPISTPPFIVKGVQQHQISEIMFGQLFNASMDKMVTERIRPVLVNPPKKKSLKWPIIACVFAIMIIASVVAMLRMNQHSQSYVEDANCGLNMKMVYVEGGTFQMGATSEQVSDAHSDEKPVHAVTLDSYYIAECEVTQGQWVKIMGTNPSHFKGNPNRPVEMVTWGEAQEFCRKLSRITGKEYRLPTEAQWEYAARGGENNSRAKYCGGNSIEEVAWYKDNSGGTTHPVKQKAPNDLGLYDMSGNVWEWCSDWYSRDYYYSCAGANPLGPTSGTNRALRGGSWRIDSACCRVSRRYMANPSYRHENGGFRVVCLP